MIGRRILVPGRPAPAPGGRAAVRAAWMAALVALAAGCQGCGAQGVPAPVGGPTAPRGLRCELLRTTDTARIGTDHPRFSWEPGGGDGARPVAYQILVGTSPDLAEGRADAWDSGRVDSPRCTGVRYEGAPLAAGRIYFWRVRTWGDGDATGAWSEEVRSFRVAGLSSMPPRLPLVAAPVEATRVARSAPGRIFLEFPSTAYGTLLLEGPSAPAGATLAVTLGEHRVGDRVWTPDLGGLPPETAVTSHGVSVAWTGGEARTVLPLPAIASPGAAPLPEGIEGILPFRFAEIAGDPRVLDGLMARQLAVTYPFDPDASTFRSSDPVLDDVWALSRHTLLATSALGIFVDGSRERTPYEADAHIDQLGHYAVDADYSLARFTAAHLMTHATWPTEWVLQAIFIAWADYLHTGDDALLRQHADALDRKALLALARQDGLISTTTGLFTEQVARDVGLEPGQVLQDIVDWPPVERDGYDMVAVNTVVNLFHLRALELLGEIAGATGRGADAVAFRARADRVRASIQARLLDASSGLFVDGEGSRHASLHANMLALAFGAAPEAAVPGILDFVEGKGMACSVYGAQYLLEALYAHGRAEAALALLTSRGPRSWGHMIYDLGATTTHEAWDPSVKPNEDWNHAWGAAPANVIARWLMGIRPLTPGFETFLVAPQPAHLAWAEIRTPTPRGPVTLRVESRPGGLAAELTVPPGAAAHFRFPPGTACEAARVDGRVVALASGAGASLGPLGPGRHAVECP